MSKKSLCHPLTRAIIHLIIGATLLHIYMAMFIEKPKSPYDISYSDAIIKDEMFNTVKQCGDGYYLFWFVMQNDKFKDQFMVKDIAQNEACDSKCRGKYAENYILNYKSKLFLDQLENNKVYFPALVHLIQYKSIGNIIDKAKNPIKDISLIVVRNEENDLIYLFSLSRTNDNLNCDRGDMKEQLLKIGNIAGEYI